MSNEQLKNTLIDLHRHLESAGPEVDAELKSLLQVLDQDIDQILSRESSAPSDSLSDASSAEDDSLASRARALSARFAAQHPQLERVLRELGIKLESMGI